VAVVLRTGSLLLLASIAAAPTAMAQAVDADEMARVSQTLDALHKAASEADFEGYFELFAAESVFLGTDATERWTRTEFMEYVRPYFEQGRGWTYLPLERHIEISADGGVAWFDERLDNASYGETRGSGVLLRQGDAWRVAQYNLTIPIPNALASQVVDLIRQHRHDQ